MQPTHEKILELLQTPSTIEEIHALFTKTERQVGIMHIRRAVRELTLAGLLQTTRRIKNRLVYEKAPAREVLVLPSALASFRPLRSIPRLLGGRTGGWNAERAPQSFQLGEQE